MSGYFVYVYEIYNSQMEDLDIILDFTPVFFSRYSYLLLSYAYMRERFITNNTFS